MRIDGGAGTSVHHAHRHIAARWPRGVPVKGDPGQMKAAAGVPLSRNEA